MKEVKYIDLFAGIGGFRKGFERACEGIGLKSRCVLTSEIKDHALKVLKDNFTHENLVGDITKINAIDIPEFDFLLAGFPCQSFSSAGNQDGFADTRGTLFFEIERILKKKKPYGFILENVSNLERHDGGRTLKIILKKLKELGYKTNYKVLNSKNFGLAQSRERIFITGTLDEEISLDNFEKKKSKLKDILQKGQPTVKNELTEKLLDHYKIEEFYGKAIKDKRGGKNNIHSWDIEIKGEVNHEQKILLGELLKQRRRKKWAEKKGIKWMDGMSLTVGEISTFFPNLLINKKVDLKKMLDDLLEKGYLKFEHPKKQVIKKSKNGREIKRRVYDTNLEKGYNIVTGKLSFSFSKILDPEDTTPTIVATDVSKLAVPDNDGLRELTLLEGLRLFGFDDEFKFDVDKKQGFDLLGNTIAIPVVESVALRILKKMKKNKNYNVEDDIDSLKAV
jgi:DNA (cytosine-5)-methyltransferase 1